MPGSRILTKICSKPRFLAGMSTSIATDRKILRNFCGIVVAALARASVLAGESAIPTPVGDGLNAQGLFADKSLGAAGEKG